MCGVAVVLGPLKVAPREALVAAMCERMAHRGPDGAGLFSSALAGGATDAPRGVTLGHRRLAIVDLSDDAAQPMVRGALSLSWNGEIYNYRELRDELRARGHSFATASDTEVLLAAIAEYGPVAALPRLNGMFALALWDGAAQRLWLGRDRFGKKPLYYLQHGDTLLVASEPKAIVLAAQTLGLRVSVQHEALASYLGDADTEVDDITFFAEIRRLRPGELLCFTPGAAGAATLVAQRHVYYALRPPEPLTLTRGEAAEHFAALLTDAVRLRLRSDVPVGAALSGGMDSSALVAVASRLGARLDTFSAVYRDGDVMDERRYIDAVVHHTGVANYQVAPETELADEGLDGPDGFTAFITHHDEPVGGASVWAQRCVFRLAAARGVRVVLSGQGADESLTGYRGALQSLIAELVRRGDLRALQKELQAQALNHPPQTLLRDLVGGAWTALRTFALPESLSHEWLQLRWSQALRDTRFFNLHALPLPPLPAPGPFHQGFNERSLLHGYLYRLLTGSSLRTILRYEDRNSMAASVESRAPFLDYRLVELCLALPATTLCHDGRTKTLLRQALHGVLPPAVAERRDKVGFAAPEGRLLLGPLRPLVQELLGSPAMAQRGLYDTRALRHMYEAATGGRESLDSYALWKALNVELWLRANQLSL